MTISKKKKKTSQDYEKSLNGLKCPSVEAKGKYL